LGVERNKIMKKQRKPLSTKKPPIPSDNHEVIENWMQDNIMPKMLPLIKKIDKIITEKIPNLNYSIKWGSAFYGTLESGWLIEVASYAVSVNIVFLNGANFNPAPPLGSGNQSRYIKLTTVDDLNNLEIIDFIEQAKELDGWK